MNASKRLLLLILAVAIILPMTALAGCAGSDGSNKKEESTITTSRTQATQQLAFAGNRNGKYALFVINIDGSGEKQITSQPEYDYAQSSWSPDGTLIAAESLGERSVKSWNGNYYSIENWGISIIDLNNGTETNLTKGNGESSPVFSPYGNLIICDGLTTYNLGGVGGNISISQPGKLGNNDMYLGSGAFNPSMSPEPIKIAFEANVAVGVDLLNPSPTPTIPPSSGDGAGVTSGASLGGPDEGTPLPYQNEIGEKEPGKRICVVDFDGTNLKQLTTSKEKYDDTYPAWSPDGKRIAFMSNRTGKNQIYVMNADGTEQTQITNDNFENHDPAWSPDGTYIAYVSDHSGISDLVIIRPDGTGRQRVNKVNELVKTPSWRPLSGQVFDVSPTMSTSSTPLVTTKPPTSTNIPATNNSTTGRLNISCSGTNSPYSIYVNGTLVGKGSATLDLAPGSYNVTIYNSKGTVVKDQTSIVIAGKDSIVKVSGAG